MVMLNKKFSAPRAKVAGKKTKPAGRASQEVLLEISLRHIKPRIWRGFSVPGNIRLDRLHNVIQAVMGWMDCHLHSFRVGKNEYLQPEPDDDVWDEGFSDIITHDESKHTLRDLIAAKGDEFRYTYDFGDSWEHEVKVKAILPAAKRMKTASCISGERACPPEDCGGFPGYEELCEALPNPKHPRHTELKDWIGEYDPNYFHVDDVNLRLSVIRV